MCGIVGIVSRGEFSAKRDLLKAIKKLEYRGYDSVGFALNSGLMKKDVGYVDKFTNKIKDVKAAVGISHTRWATHGGVTKTNAHPHFNKQKTIFAVHNGIIENFSELRDMLKKKGYKFITETDSEIIPHFFDYQLKQKKSMQQAMRAFVKAVKGTFAILLIRKGENKIYALKRDSPLVLGLCKNSLILGSDIYAFSDKTNKAIYFDDNECAIVGQDSFTFFNGKKSLKKKIITFEWNKEEVTKKKFKHFMIKEVFEQPSTSKRLLDSFKTTQKQKLNAFADMVKKSKRVVFVSCGTSYHASLIGAMLMRKIGMNAHTVIASEFESFLKVDKNTLVIAISQSGETMDVVTVLKEAKKQGSKIASIVNVPYSTIQRLSDLSIETVAGQEICVAATKTFTNQIVTLLALAKKLGVKENLEGIPARIKQTLEKNETKVKALAKKLYKKNDVFVLGRGMSYPIAREIALKLKEISYVHAEGMMGGELKHGTIALVEKGTPIISLIPNHDADMISNTKEVEARGADIIIISDAMGRFYVPNCNSGEFAIYACMIGHLLSYYIAVLRKLPIDKPRNLAKSVTVK